MNRVLLAFLALLAGLVAQAGPVHARGGMGEGVEIGAVQGLGADRGQIATVSHSAVILRTGTAPADIDLPHVGGIADLHVPTVLIGIDRARQ